MPSDRTWERLVCEDCGEPYSGQPPLDCVHGRCNPQRAATPPEPPSASTGRAAAEHVYQALSEWDKNIFLDERGLDHLSEAILAATPRPVVDVDQIVTFIEQGLRKAWSKDVRGSAKAVMPVIERVLRTELAAMPTAGVCKLCGERASVMCRPCSVECTKDVLAWQEADAVRAAAEKVPTAFDRWTVMPIPKNLEALDKAIDALRDALKGKPCESAD